MKKSTRLFILIVSSWLFPYFVSAYNLTRISGNNLTNSAITSFCQDEKGLMLIGTCDGLNFYNSRDLYAYQPVSEQHFLSGSIIDKILYAGDDLFWVQTYYGLNRFDARTNTVTHFNDFQKLYFMETDRDGNLFIIRESNSIYYYHKKSSSFRMIIMTGILFSDIAGFFVDSTNKMWVISKKGYSVNFEILTDEAGNITLKPAKGKYNTELSILYSFYDENTIHIVDSDFNLITFDATSGKQLLSINLKEDIAKRGKITSVLRHHENYFIGFQTSGLLLLEKNKKDNRFSKKEIEIENGIFCLKKDRLQDIVWIGTDGGGIYIYYNSEFWIRSYDLSKYTPSIQRPVRALLLDDNNTLWVGSKGDGILKLHNYNINRKITDGRMEAVNTSNSRLPDNIIYAFYRSNLNGIWIGSEEGLSFYSYATNSVVPVEVKINNSGFKYIHSIYETADKKLWLTSVGMGVVCADIVGSTASPTLANIRHFTVNNSDFESNYFFSLYAENDTTLWFANRGYGVFRFNTTTQNLDPANNYSNYPNQIYNEVFAINKDLAGNLLVGTGFGLIKHLSRQKQKNFNSRNSLLNNSVHAIVKSEGNNFWISTNKGIALFDSNRDHIRIFDKPDGMQITEFSDGAAYFDKKSGTLFFGGINGYVAIRKDKGNEHMYMPQVFFDRLSILGNRVNIKEKIRTDKHGERLVLKYEQNFISLSFTAIDYINGGNFVYYYKIDELNESWINNGLSNQASFTNLAPGKYTLMVKYYNRILDQESDVYTLAITILPPWYQSRLAKVVYLLLIMAFAGVLIWYLRRRQERRKNVFLEKIEKKHQREVFDSKLQFFTTIAHEFCTPLTLISGPCERILSQNNLPSFVRNYVKIIQVNAERLNSLIVDLIEFRRIETGNRKLTVETLDIKSLIQQTIEMFAGMSSIKDIEIELIVSNELSWNSDKGFLVTILSNLISNALKYSPEHSKVTISINETDGKLELQLINQGSPINEAYIKHMSDVYAILNNFENQETLGMSKSGLGLAITYNLVSLLKGIIDIKNTNDSFVVFTITLPQLELTDNNELPSKQFSIQVAPPVLQQPSVIKLPELVHDHLKPTMLLFASNDEMLWLMSDLFSDDFNVKTAGTTDELNTVLEDDIPDIVVCDITPHQVMEAEITRKIKQNKETAHIPVVVISGQCEVETQIEALEAGAEIFINKPFDTKYLKLSVRQILERKENLKDYFSSPMSSFETIDGKLTHREHKKLLRSIIKVVNENINNDDLSIQFIAEKLGIGTRTLYRKIKETGHESMAVIIKDCRLHVAADLLVKSTLTIEEIAYKSGFANKSTFFKAFQQKFDCTPKQYRTKETEK